MKRILLSVIVAGMAFVPGMAQHSQPEKGDIGAIVYSKFENKEDAMQFVVQEILFRMNIIPETYDADLGYLVTERFYFQGWLNCQFVFMFKTDGDRIAVKILGRNYENNQGSGMHRGPMKYAKGMPGSPVDSYWGYLTGIAEKIPSSSIEYFGS